MGSWFTNQKLGLSLWVGVLSPGHWTTRVLLTPSSIIGENSHKSLHLNPRPSTTQLSEVPSAGCLTQRISKQEHSPKQQQAGRPQIPQHTPPHTAPPISRKKLTSTGQNAGTSPSQHEAYTSHWTNLTHQGQRWETRTMTLQPEDKLKVKVKSLSRVWLFVTPWLVAYQASPSMGFFRQEYWSGLPFPSLGDLPDPGIEPRSPAL